MSGTETTGDGRRILGPKNPRILELRRLIGRRSSRSPDVVLEGPRTVVDALDHGIVPTVVVIPERAAEADEVSDVVRRLDPTTEVLVVRDRAFDGIAPAIRPQPMLAVITRPTAEIPERPGTDAVVLVLVGVADPGNVGTLVRVADAVAAACVVIVGGADPWGPKAVRAAAGSMLRVPVVVGPDADDALGRLRDSGYRIVGTDVRDGEPHDGGVLAGPVAIVLGSEPRGLDRSIDDLVDAWTRIDMPGPTESLNVAMAGTLLAYEARRSASSG